MLVLLVEFIEGNELLYTMAMPGGKIIRGRSVIWRRDGMYLFFCLFSA